MSFKEMAEVDIVNVNKKFDKDVEELAPLNFEVNKKNGVIEYSVINSMHDGLEIVTLAKDKLK